MNKNAFRSVMVYHGDTQKDVADLLGITEQSIGDKLSGKSEFRQGEIKLIIARYGLTPAQTDEIFFGGDTD